MQSPCRLPRREDLGLSGEIMISERLAGIYNRLEDGFYKIVDFLSAKGIPVGKFTDLVDNRGIPAFPFTIGVAVIIIALVYGFAFVGTTFNSELQITFNDDFGDTVQGVSVAIYDADNTTKLQDPQSVNSGGKISLENIGIGTNVTVRAEKTGYESASKEVTVSRDVVAVRMELKKIVKIIDAMLVLKDIETNDIITNAELSAVWKNQTVNGVVEKGVFHLRGLVENEQVVLRVSADGYEDAEETISFTEGNVKEVYLAPKSIHLQGMSDLTIYIYDADTELPLSGAAIQLRDKETDALIVDDVVGTGEYFIELNKGTSLKLSVTKEDYIAYNSVDAYDDVTLREDQEAWDVFLAKGGTRLTVNTVDGSGTLLSDVTVMLFSSESELISEAISGFGGFVEFNGLSSDETYYLTGHSDGYLPTRKEVSTATDETISLVMENATSENSALLAIYVTTSDNLAGNSALLTFFEKVMKENEEGVTAETLLPLGIPNMEADAAGYASVSIDVGKEVVVQAEREHEEGEGSTVIIPEVLNEIRITLERAITIKEIIFTDSAGRSVAGTIEIRSVAGELLFTGNLADDGSVIFDARGNDYVDVTIVAEDGTTYSEQVRLDAETKTVVIGAGGTVGYEPFAKFNGVFNDEGESVEGIEPNDFYWLEFETNWPEGVYTGGLHVRVGDDDVKFADSQEVGILGFDAVSDDFIYGTSYSPEPAPGNESIDLQNPGNGGEYNKWLEVYFENPEDIEIVRVKVRARDIAEESEFEVHYRAWTTLGDKYNRFPADSVIGSEQFTLERTGLYAETLTETVNVFEGKVKCEEGICATYRFLDSDFLEIAEDEFGAKVGGVYALEVALYSEKTLTAEIKFNTDRLDAKLEFIGHEIDSFSDSMPQLDSGDTSVNMQNLVLIENVEKKIRVYFRAKKEGIKQFITAQVISGTIVLNKEFYFNITKDGELSLALIPSEIKIGEDFTVKATDVSSGVGVKDAVVRLKDEQGEILKTVMGSNRINRGMNGKYEFENSYSSGVYTVEAEADGYAKAEISFLISDESALGIAELVEVGIARGAKNGVAIEDIRNNSTFNINSISFEVKGDRLFEKNFKVSIEGPAVLGPNNTAGVRFNVEYIGDEEEKTLLGQAEVKITGLLEGAHSVSAKTTLKAYYNKQIDEDCLVFGHRELQATLVGGAAVSKEIELDIENKCDVQLVLNSRVESSKRDPNLEVTVPSITLARGEKRTITMTVLNKIDRQYAAQQLRSFNIYFEAGVLAKNLRLGVTLWHHKFALNISENMTLWLSRGKDEPKARTSVPLFIRNTGLAPIHGFAMDVRYKDDEWRKHGINVTVEPSQFTGPLGIQQALLPVRMLTAEADLEKTIENSPVHGQIEITGTIDGKKYTLRTINVAIHASAYSCLEVAIDSDLMFESAESAFGTISKEIGLTNNCAEEVRITKIEPDTFNSNKLSLIPLGTTVIAPGQSARFRLLLQKGSAYQRDDIGARVLGVLVKAGKVIESKSFPIGIRLGADVIEESGAAHPAIDMPFCTDDDTPVGSASVKFPKLSEDECGKGYCDAKGLAKYLGGKINLLIEQAKNKRGSAGQFPGCGPEKDYCTFYAMGITSKVFTAFMQNDFLTDDVLADVIQSENLGNLKGYFIATSDPGKDFAEIAGTGFTRNVYISDNIMGCGKYGFKIDGAVQVQNGTIVEDSYVIYLKVQEPGRVTTPECTNKIQNVMNFLPVDEGYTLANNSGAWPAMVESGSDLAVLARGFAKELFGSESRATSSAPNNKMKLEFGDIGSAIVKIKMARTGQADEPKTITSVINKAYKEGGDEIKATIGKEVADAISALKRNSVEGCISTNEDYFIITGKGASGNWDIEPAVVPSLEVFITPHCVDMNVYGNLPFDVKLRTDWEDKEVKTGLEEVCIRDAEASNDCTDTSHNILKDDTVKMKKNDERGRYEKNFKLCVKGAKGTYTLVPETVGKIKVTAKTERAYVGGEVLSSIEEKTRDVDLEVCGVYPIDLYKELFTGEEGIYYATVGWAGDEDEVLLSDLFRSMKRYDALGLQDYIIEGFEEGSDKLNEELKGQRLKAVGIGYFPACAVVAGVCGAVSKFGWGALWDIFFDCAIPAAWAVAPDVGGMDKARDWLEENWSAASRFVSESWEEQIRTGGEGGGSDVYINELLEPAIVSTIAGDVMTTIARTSLEVTPGTAGSAAKEAAGLISQRIDARYLSGITDAAVRNEIRNEIRGSLQTTLQRNFVDSARIPVPQGRLGRVMTPKFNTVLPSGETFLTQSLKKSLGEFASDNLGDILIRHAGAIGASPLGRAFGNAGTTHVAGLLDAGGMSTNIKNGITVPPAETFPNGTTAPTSTWRTGKRTQMINRLSSELQRDIEREIFAGLDDDFVNQPGMRSRIQTEITNGLRAERGTMQNAVKLTDAVSGGRRGAPLNYTVTAEVINGERLAEKVSRNVVRGVSANISDDIVQFARRTIAQTAINASVTDELLYGTSKTSIWTRMKSAFTGMFSRSFWNNLGKGMLCGVLANGAGYGGWLGYWNWYAKPIPATHSLDEPQVRTPGQFYGAEPTFEEMALERNRTYRIEVTEGDDGKMHFSLPKLVLTDEDVTIMDEEIENGTATSMNKDCAGEFVKKPLQYIYGSLNPSVNEIRQFGEVEGRGDDISFTSIYFEHSKKIMDTAINRGVNEALLTAVLLEDEIYAQDDFTKAIKTAARTLASLNNDECGGEDMPTSARMDQTQGECILEKYAEGDTYNPNLREDALIETFERWNNYWLDIGLSSEDAGGEVAKEEETRELREIIEEKAPEHLMNINTALAISYVDNDLQKTGLFDVGEADAKEYCGEFDITERGDNVECAMTVLQEHSKNYGIKGCDTDEGTREKCTECGWEMDEFKGMDAAIIAYKGWECGAEDYLNDVKHVLENLSSIN